MKLKWMKGIWRDMCARYLDKLIIIYEEMSKRKQNQCPNARDCPLVSCLVVQVF